MTKEELEEEAEDYANKTRIKDKNTYVSFNDECISELQDYEGNYMDISERIIKTYIDSAEPREKRIAELEDKLANADYQLEGRDNEIRELKVQIEKMQNCRNCKNEKIEGACGHFTQVGWCRDWELAD